MLLKYVLLFIAASVSVTGTAYTASGGVLNALQRQMVFPGTGLPADPISDTQLQQHGIERWWLSAGDARVEAWLLPAATTTPAPAVIFAHGNGELIEMWPEILEEFTRLGFHLLLVEYPGYGRSTGKPDIPLVNDIFRQAYDRLVTDARVDADHLIGFGRSLGGGAITALAKTRKLHALILASTFTSLKDMAKRFMLPPFLVRDNFDNLGLVLTFTGPILVVHGKQDQLIPYTHGAALVEAGRNTTMLSYRAGHNDCPPNWDQFWQDLSGWLKKTGMIP